MHYFVADMYRNGPDAEDREDGYHKGSNGKLYWNDPTGKHESMVYAPKQNRFRKMTDAEHAEHNSLK